MDNFSPMSNTGGQVEECHLKVCFLPCFSQSMLTVQKGYLAFPDAFKLGCDYSIMQLWLQQDHMHSLQILGTICQLHCFSTPTFCRMLTQTTCWLCIMLVQVLTNIPPILTSTPSSCTFNYVSIMAVYIVNARWYPEKDIDRWSPIIRQSFCHTNGQFRIWCNDWATYPIQPHCFLQVPHPPHFHWGQDLPHHHHSHQQPPGCVVDCKVGQRCGSPTHH